MKSILILEDQYTKSIYEGLHSIFPDYEFPLTDIINDPMEYVSLFEKVDMILLDNYFPGKDGGWEEPLGCNVLEYLLSQNSKQKVVCISDYQTKLLDRYDVWEKAHEKGLVYGFPSKDISAISNLIFELD